MPRALKITCIFNQINLKENFIFTKGINGFHFEDKLPIAYSSMLKW